ncbi:component of the Tol biopolymer transport system [Amycolatopsis xylanica]|uniref:Component of the Tol biopolymer transport system n=1 Tax=Amycolatopsis xylanica TaxID=589385 RepID=A0A1H3DCR9_9PSEU|nr:amidohydrolase family protein [Amycolatopsis xylanica]SDX64181.1 component of the Tol biopolymer transport system [Amycolatopsis xylanica]
MSGELTRRNMLIGTGAAAVAAGLVGTETARADPETTETPQESSKKTTVREGTNISVAVSPDGKLVAFDLLTNIWVVPIAGGEARRLTDDFADATQPAFSPDGRRLVFQSYRDGNYHLWSIGVDGSGARQHTQGPFDHREPKFSPDGASIVFASDRGGSYGVHRLTVATGEITKLTDTAAEEATPGWSHDGKRVAYTVDDLAIDVLELESGVVTRAVTAPAGAKVYGPSFAPDGKLAYVRLTGAKPELVVGDQVVTGDEDVFAFPVGWLAADELLYTADGRIRRRKLGGTPPVDVGFTATVPFVAKRKYRQLVRDLDDHRERQAQGIASPVVSRDGSQVAFRALNALWLLKIGERKPRKLLADGYFNSDPDFSPDGKTLVYASDKAGDADLWSLDIATGGTKRLTGLPGAQLTPRFSPDGSRIAYQDHDGATWIVDVAGGVPKQVAPTLFMPGRPTWSPDGTTLALAAVKPYSKRYREGTSQILLVNLRAGTLQYSEPMPHASLSTRGDDGPVWSPDGKYLSFVVESTAWIVPVDATGTFTGQPKQVTHEVTDSLAWVGSDALLYLNNGELRTQSIAGGPPATVPVDLRWQRPVVRQKLVVRAGALWDGKAKELRRNVDVIVDGDRIAGVVPAGPGPATVDASTRTVMPGLIDAHVHWHLRGRQWGARQGRLWLAYGITSTRSPGDPAYQMVETREALESGALTGPRFFATGEAIDGSRVYYNFMRPNRSISLLDKEFERARKLRYDLIKTYVRFPNEYQAAAVAAAHRAGLPLTSHYLYPAAHLGMDGMEHYGATNRLGYSHTGSRIGRTYGDVVALFAGSGMGISTTLFNSSVLYGDDRSLVTDRRTRVLNPSWEYDRLVQKADDARTPAAETMRAILKGQAEMMLRIQRAGGVVLAGTDAPLDNIAISLHTNLRAMVRYGFTPYEALTAATANPARWLGLDGTIGVIAPRAKADLVIVDGDPLTDIAAAAAVRGVMVGGQAHTVDELLAPYEHPAAATAQIVQSGQTAQFADEWWHRPEWTDHACCGD